MNIVKSTVGLGGEFRLVKYRQGRIVQETDWFSNLILDSGLERWGTNGIIDRCAIGTGTTAPAVTNTQLQAFSASTTVQQSDTWSAEASPPHRQSRVRVYRFNAGTLNGNYTEVGVGWSDTTMFSRALIQTSGGVPTSITVLSDEVLDVYYRLRTNPPLTDVTGIINIGGVNYNYTLRASNVTSSGSWDVPFAQRFYFGGNGIASAYDGPIGLITSSPSGSSSFSSSVSTAPYVSGSLQNLITMTWGLDQGNFVSGIRAISTPSSAGAMFQVEFSPAIPKDNTKVFSITLGCSWARL